MISVTAYLENEKVSDLRSEYIDGHCLPIIGGGRAHDLLCARLARLLRQGVAEAGCKLYRASFKVRIRSGDAERFYYPDFQVASDTPSCGEQPCVERIEQPDYLESPKLVLEVLSPTSKERDRDVKATDYQQIDSLQELVLVSDDSECIEIRRRDNGWAVETYGCGERFSLQTIATELAVTDIYEVLSGKPNTTAKAGEGSARRDAVLCAAG